MARNDDNEHKTKRVKKDPFHLEPSYISIPVRDVLLFDAIGDGIMLPRLPQRSMALFDLDGERGLLRTFACGGCKDISSTASRVPCSCGVLCDTCKTRCRLVSGSSETEFVCMFCSSKYTPQRGHELCPPLSSHSRPIGCLFEWVAGNCSATCHVCSRSYESIRAVHMHLPDCAKSNIRLCTSISCLKPIACDEPHKCGYDRSFAESYGQVSSPIRTLHSDLAFCI
jgi:hypothetical protein